MEGHLLLLTVLVMCLPSTIVAIIVINLGAIRLFVKVLVLLHLVGKLTDKCLELVYLAVLLFLFVFFLLALIGFSRLLFVCMVFVFACM